MDAHISTAKRTETSMSASKRSETAPSKPSRPKPNHAYVPAEPWFGEKAGCEKLGRELDERGTDSDVTDPLFQEYVAREALDGSMPVIELHRNHGIPLSAVRRWIDTFRRDGRAGLEAAAAAARARKPMTAKSVEMLRQRLRSKEEDVMLRALKTVVQRRIVTLADDVLALLERRELIQAILVLGRLGAIGHLEQGLSFCGHGYDSWFASAFERAGCSIEKRGAGWFYRRPGSDVFLPLRDEHKPSR